MRALWKVLTSLVLAGLLLVAVPAASAQKPKPMPTQPQPAPMAQRPAQQQVVVVEPIRVFDPFFTYRIRTHIRPITWRLTSDS